MENRLDNIENSTDLGSIRIADEVVAIMLAWLRSRLRE